jgi:hypothetical protein
MVLSQKKKSTQMVVASLYPSTETGKESLLTWEKYKDGRNLLWEIWKR